jgi:tRNA threonylcarbamoyladenosine biosynthesis protein TsaE
LSKTAELGECIGEALQAGTLIGLVGALGTGKTNLTQSIGRAIGIADGNVVSPTFTICVPHRGRLLLLHMDAYRIKQPEEVDELGLDEQLEEGAVVIVEWSDLIEQYLRPLDLRIEITAPSEQSRSMKFTSQSGRGDAVVTAIIG